MMQILDLLGMYFDTAVVFVTNSSLLFSFTLATLWIAQIFVAFSEKLNFNKNWEYFCIISRVCKILLNCSRYFTKTFDFKPFALP